MAGAPETPRTGPLGRARRAPADPRTSRLARERHRHIVVVRLFMVFMLLLLAAAHLGLLFLSRILTALF